jgi:peptidoglycan/xylan/chitin deacetylase (PgdA/CDA1 family)
MQSSWKAQAALWLCALAGAAAAGCGKTSAALPGATPAALRQTRSSSASSMSPASLTVAQLAQVKPNEAGVVPILEYHSIGPKEDRWTRSVTNFRHDLLRLYQEGYRPITIAEYLANRIALPPGKSPVLLTFDDARGSQFRYLPNGAVDPDCAVGILQSFAKAHPDFPVHAVFYVLPLSGFEQKDRAAKKMQDLLAMGCEIGNHTVRHLPLSHLSDTEVQKELAGCVALVQKMAPQAKVDTIALPDGVAPRNRALLASGAYEGQRYVNRAALLVGANPAPSPVSPKFKPMHLPRIQATEGVMGITYWLDDLQRHPGRRYVSDGDPNTITVPRSQQSAVDKAKLNGASLRLY